MQAKKTKSKSKTMNISWKNILIGISVLLNIFALIAIISLGYMYKNGYMDWLIIENLTQNSFAHSGACFGITNQNIIKDLTAENFTDKEGRTVFKDPKGNQKVFCMQFVSPQQADEYQNTQDSRN
ncbi:MAG: hypothetical protein WCP56_03540 [Candidatus Saccharibacteria bacterium]